jgi:hypothetical protein
MDGQTKRGNKIHEDMLRACVLGHQGSRDKNLPWAEFSYNNRNQERLRMAPFEGSRDKNLPWAEFSYNNSNQERLRMAPFEVLYGRRCHTPLN